MAFQALLVGQVWMVTRVELRTLLGIAQGRGQLEGECKVLAPVEQAAEARDGEREQAELEEEVGEQGPLPNLRPAPVRPDQQEVDRHYASGHVPRRFWCPACSQASMEDDFHFQSKEDQRDDGLAVVCLDFKELSNNQPPHVVMRKRTTGATYGVRTVRKGSEDRWVVERLITNIECWGLQEF